MRRLKMILSKRRRRYLLRKVSQIYEQWMPAWIILGLFLGILGARFATGVVTVADTAVTAIIDGITLLAPISIFMILAPAVTRIIKMREEEGKFITFVLGGHMISRALTALWAALFTVVILGLPFLPTHQTGNIGQVLLQSAQTLTTILLKSPFFISIWVSVVVGFVGSKNERLFTLLDHSGKALDWFGDRISPFVPLLMFVLGAYLYSLPQNLVAELGENASLVLQGSGLGSLTVLGWHMSITSNFGLVWIYIVGSLMIGLGCFLWQGMEFIFLKKYIPGFSIVHFVKNYWLKVYPLAWSTSSEVVSFPLNVSLVRKNFKQVSSFVRKFTMSLGLWLEINGTTMHVIVLTGIVASLVGFSPSLLELILAIPLVMLLGFGVAGFPGELVIFAVPMATIVNIPTELTATFIALYLALQIGLPDSFRTGANVTDEGINVLVADQFYKNNYGLQETDKLKPALLSYLNHKTKGKKLALALITNTETKDQIKAYLKTKLSDIANDASQAPVISQAFATENLSRK